MLSDLDIVIISVVGGALATAAIERAFRVLESVAQSRGGRGHLAGTWYQHIPAQRGEPAKLDRVECRHAGERLSGTIVRLSPPSATDRRWEFSGQARKDYIFLAFHSVRPKPNPWSYGTIQLLDTEGDLTGSYVRPRLKETQPPTVDTTPVLLTWTRKPPEGT